MTPSLRWRVQKDDFEFDFYYLMSYMKNQAVVPNLLRSMLQLVKVVPSLHWVSACAVTHMATSTTFAFLSFLQMDGF